VEEDCCDNCGGVGWLELDTFVPGRGRGGRTVPCPDCEDRDRGALDAYADTALEMRLAPRAAPPTAHELALELGVPELRGPRA
jgi:hypothetical protein